MTSRAQQRLREAVVRVLGRTASGQSASKVVEVVVSRERVAPEEVRRQVRSLLESGHIVVGPDLNLLVKKTPNPVARKTG
jgi:hypothetical protein